MTDAPTRRLVAILFADVAGFTRMVEAIVVSAKVRDEVTGKLEVTFADRGEQRLKNHAAPVRAYAVGTGGSACRPFHST